MADLMEILNQLVTPISDLNFGYDSQTDTVFSMFTQNRWSVDWLRTRVHTHKDYQFLPYYIFALEQKNKVLSIPVQVPVVKL